MRMCSVGPFLLTKKTSNEGRLKVFPNPATSNLNIEWSREDQAYFELVDLTGRKVDWFELPGMGGKVLDVSKQSKGIYFLNVYSSGKRLTQKVAVN